MIMIPFLFNGKQSVPERLLRDSVCPQRKQAITFYHDDTENDVIIIIEKDFSGNSDTMWPLLVIAT